MSAQETAEAIIIVIKRLAKWLLFLLLGLVILGVGFWGIDTVINYYKYDRHKDKVVVRAEFNNKECNTSEYPLYVFIGNSSEKKVMSVNFDISVNRVGRSTKLNSYDDYDSDAILKPNIGISNCYVVYGEEYDENHNKTTLDGKEMEVEVTNYSVVFEH